MTNLDEKKLDELIKKMAFEKYPVVWIPAGNKEVKYDPNAPNRNHFIRVYKDGYRQAFADQGDKIKRLEKAVELMREGLKEIQNDNEAQYGLSYQIHETLEQIDEILK